MNAHVIAAAVRWPIVAGLALAAAACGGTSESGGELHARKVVLQREVEGLRGLTARLERHEPMLPVGDVGIAIEESLLRDIIAAQLPFEVDVDRYHLSLKEAEVIFRGSPVVRLRGTLNLKALPSLLAQVNVVGALENVDVNAATSTLTAKITIDHLGIEKAAGIERYLSGSTMDDVARMIRVEIKDQMPPVQIPVDVQQNIDLPAVTRGPVRIHGARLPLKVAVSQVVASRGKLWIAVHFEPGVVVKTADAPEAGDATAAETEFSLAADEAPAGKTPANAPAKTPQKAPAKPPARAPGKEQ
jgi:hypothetical protein